MPANTSIIEITKDFDYEADRAGRGLWHEMTELYNRVSPYHAAQARRNMPANEYHHSFAIIDDSADKILSAMTCQLHEKQTMTIDLLATDKACEGKGFASILIDYLKSSWNKLSVERIQLAPVREKIDFYVKRGFKCYATHDHDKTFHVTSDDAFFHGMLEFFVNGDAGRKQWMQKFEKPTNKDKG